MRCKVTCSFKQVSTDSVTLYFSPVTSGSEENKKFFKYTPGGQFMIYSVNMAIADQFEIGKEYYVDFSGAAQ